METPSLSDTDTFSAAGDNSQQETEDPVKQIIRFIRVKQEHESSSYALISSEETTLSPSSAMMLTSVLVADLSDLDTTAPPVDTSMTITVQDRAAPKELKAGEVRRCDA